jgi:hypothetical protein
MFELFETLKTGPLENCPLAYGLKARRPFKKLTVDP